MDTTIAEFEIAYGYHQFYVFDNESGPGLVATEMHFRQGFCRSLSAACFLTLDQWGIAHVKVRKDKFDDCSHLCRLISVPFFAPSGVIGIQGPEDPPPVLFSVGRGHFRLWVGQYLIEDEEECIEVYFEELATPAEKSEIVIKDEFLQPGPQLLED
jgi:hypothetical protein